MLIILSWLKKLKPQALNDRVRISKYKNIFSKSYTENWSRVIFVIDSVSKISSWTYKIKYINDQKILGSLYEKELLLSKLWMSYYQKPDSYIRDKVKVVLDLSNYAPKNKLKHATGTDAPDLAAKNILILLKLTLTNQTLVNWLMFQLVWII